MNMGTAQHDHCDDGAGRMKAIGSVSNNPDFVVESFDDSVG